MQDKGITVVRFDVPRLFLMCGGPGTGKSTLAKKVARQLHFMLIDKDTIQDPFSESRKSELYKKVSPATYDAMWGITTDNLLVGNSVIVDAPLVIQLRDPNWVDTVLLPIIEETSALLKIGFCWLGKTVHQRRLRTRGEERDRWKLEDWDAYVKVEDPAPDLDFANVLYLWNKKPIYLLLEEIKEYLQDEAPAKPNLVTKN